MNRGQVKQTWIVKHHAKPRVLRNEMIQSVGFKESQGKEVRVFVLSAATVSGILRTACVCVTSRRISEQYRQASRKKGILPLHWSNLNANAERPIHTIWQGSLDWMIFGEASLRMVGEEFRVNLNLIAICLTT